MSNTELLQKAQQGDVQSMFDLMLNYIESGAGSDDINLWGRKLAYEHEIPYAMVILGTIYCGGEGNEFIKMNSKLKSLYNPTEGFKLIHKADEKEKNLPYMCYNAICDAYHSAVRKAALAKGNIADYVPGTKGLEGLEKNIYYAKKALASAIEENEPPQIQETWRQMVAAKEGELNALKTKDGLIRGFLTE